MRSIRLIIGVLLLGFAAYWFLFHIVPRLYDDWTHVAEFVPAKTAKIIEAKCKNYSLVLFNDCTVSVETTSGSKFEIEDMRFGRAPSDAVRLLERPASPPVYTTDVSLATLNGRLYFAIFAVFLSLLFVVGMVLSIFRAMRRRPAKVTGAAA